MRPSPREAYLEEENFQLRQKVDLYERAGNHIPVYSIYDDPPIMKVPDPIQHIKLSPVGFAGIKKDNMYNNYHLLAETATGINDYHLAYQVSDRDLFSKEKVHIIDVMFERLKRKLYTDLIIGKTNG